MATFKKTSFCLSIENIYCTVSCNLNQGFKQLKGLKHFKNKLMAKRTAWFLLLIIFFIFSNGLKNLWDSKMIKKSHNLLSFFFTFYNFLNFFLFNVFNSRWPSIVIWLRWRTRGWSSPFTFVWTLGWPFILVLFSRVWARSWSFPDHWWSRSWSTSSGWGPGVGSVPPQWFPSWGIRLWITVWSITERIRQEIQQMKRFLTVLIQA